LPRPLSSPFRYFAPPSLPPGPYTLAAVLYDPATLEPVLTSAGDQMGVLAEVLLSPPAPAD